MVPTIDHFIGQNDVVKRVKVALEAAWNDGGARLPHMLMVGPPGTGKTTIAQVIAKELAVKCHELIGQAVTGPENLNGLLLEAEDKDLVFIDEIHELHTHGQTLLYRAMEDGTVFINGVTDKVLSLPLNDITVIGATTDEYMLLEPLRQRFQLVLPFQFYDSESLARITLQRARMIGVELAAEVAQEIAIRARGTPRLAIRLLEACRRFARSRGEHNITAEHFTETVELEGLDHLGLGQDEQKYLRLLAERPSDALRLFSIEAALGINRWTLQRVVEPFLVRLRLVERDEDGRRITAKGLEHLGLLESEVDVPF